MGDLKISKKTEGAEMTIELSGRLDTNTSPEFESLIETSLDGVEKLIIDLKELAYISSAGLRVLLTALQIMEDQGSMVVRNVSQEVMDVFEITGFIDDLTIE